MFETYPDIVSVENITQMMNLGKLSVYYLLKSGHIKHVRVGKKYIIPKKSVIDFLAQSCDNVDTIINGRQKKSVIERSEINDWKPTH